MMRSLGVNTDRMKIMGLGISNGLVALSGAILAQYQGFADISMGIGMIVAGLASVIVGEVLLGVIAALSGFLLRFSALFFIASLLPCCYSRFQAHGSQALYGRNYYYRSYLSLFERVKLWKDDFKERCKNNRRNYQLHEKEKERRKRGESA